MTDWVIFLFIHVLIPIGGIVAYLVLVRKMKNDNTPKAPVAQLFWIFGIYGVVIMLLITSLIGA